jgi:predicted phosphodiesterase
MADKEIDLLVKGTLCNKSDEFRRGNVIGLPGEGEVVVTGDIHGNHRNLDRVFSYADLENNPKRHVILQEIIHGGPTDAQGGCLSYKVLFEAIEYKLKYPGQVHFIMGNHDVSFIIGGKVMKDGREMNELMCLGLDNKYGERSEKIKGAIREFLFSQALAVRGENRLWVSHSLPSERYIKDFSVDIFARDLEISDLERNGSVYLLTWGRNISQKALDELVKILDSDIFIVGHQAQKQGWKQAEKNLLIIASDHSHGCLVTVELSESSGIKKIAESIVPLASIS